MKTWIGFAALIAALAFAVISGHAIADGPVGTVIGGYLGVGPTTVPINTEAGSLTVTRLHGGNHDQAFDAGGRYFRFIPKLLTTGTEQAGEFYTGIEPPGAAPSGYYTSFGVEANVNSASYVGQANALTSSVRMGNTGGLGTARGLFAQVYSGGSGARSINTGMAIFALPFSNNGPGTVTMQQSHGLLVGSPAPLAGDSVVTANGVVIRDQGVTGVGRAVGLDVQYQTPGSQPSLGVRNASTTVQTPRAAVLTAGTPLTVSSSVVTVSAAAPVTITSTPTIVSGEDGERVLLVNTGANAITLQDETVLAGSNLRLRAGTVTLAQYGAIEVIYLAGDWVQVTP